MTSTRCPTSARVRRSLNESLARAARRRRKVRELNRSDKPGKASARRVPAGRAAQEGHSQQRRPGPGGEEEQPEGLEAETRLASSVIISGDQGGSKIIFG